jgi:hypothetical protein
MKSLSDSAFAVSLRHLSLVLADREKKRLPLLIRDYAQVVFLALADCLTDENVRQMLNACEKIISDINATPPMLERDTDDSLFELVEALVEITSCIGSVISLATETGFSIEMAGLRLAQTNEEVINALNAAIDKFRLESATRN